MAIRVRIQMRWAPRSRLLLHPSLSSVLQLQVDSGTLKFTSRFSLHSCPTEFPQKTSQRARHNVRCPLFENRKSLAADDKRQVPKARHSHTTGTLRFDSTAHHCRRSTPAVRSCSHRLQSEGFQQSFDVSHCRFEVDQCRC